MIQRLHSFRLFLSRHKIVVGLSSAIVVALTLTVVSMWIYNTSDVARIDISRPGYEKARESVIKGDETISFGATGTLDSNAMKDFQQLFDEKRKSLNAIGDFDGSIISDEQLKASSSN